MHVADCYIWAAIQYLDSPTDYREYLPSKVGVVTPKDELVMLGDKRPSAMVTFLQILLGAAFACIFLPILLRACG